MKLEKIKNKIILIGEKTTKQLMLISGLHTVMHVCQWAPTCIFTNINMHIVTHTIYTYTHMHRSPNTDTHACTQLHTDTHVGT